MSNPTPAQMNCGHALYGPPALCTCGTCGICNRCGGEGSEADYYGLKMEPVEIECSACNGTGKAEVTKP
jgi:hypothetical protein